MNTAQATTRRIEALTSLRFFAAFVVVSFHYGLNTALVAVAPGIFTAGSEMVTLFFVLSGFVLTLAYAGKAHFSAVEYFINRVARIAPAYYLALAIVVLGSLSHGLSGIDPVALLLSASFLQSWVPTYPRTLNIPAWSLSVEIAFYLVFPLVLRVALRMRLQNLLLASLALWALTQLVVTSLLNSSWYLGHPFTYDLLFFFPPVHFCSFLLGICGARLLAARSGEGAPQPGEFWAGTKTVGICVLTLIALEARLGLSESMSFMLPFAGSLLSPLFLLLILQLALGHDVWARALSLPVFVALGRASYSFYILQVPVHRIFIKVGSPYLPDNADIQFWTFVAALCVISILSQKFVELPAARIVRRFRPAKSPQQRPDQAVPAITEITATQPAKQ